MPSLQLGIEFTNLANWIIKAPIKIELSNDTLRIVRPNGTNTMTQCGYIINELLKFGIDPMDEVCSMAVHKLYEAYYGKI